MSAGMSGGKLNAGELIAKLEKILIYLDENGLAIAAIKIEEAISALQQVKFESSEDRNGEI